MAKFSPITILIALQIVAAVTSQITDATLASASKIAVQQLNAFRKLNNVPLIADNAAIYTQCLNHSKYMASTGILTHNGFSNRISSLGFRVGTAAENVAYFSKIVTTADQIATQFITQWKNSAGHRANMLNKYVNLASVGIARNGSKYYATMILVQKI